jgi:hypothetical protein
LDLNDEHFNLAVTIRSEPGLWAGNEELFEDCWRHDTNELHFRFRAFYTADEALSVIVERLWELVRDE